MTTLDGTAIQQIERLVQGAAPILYPKGEQTGVYLLRDNTGNYLRVQADLDPQDVTLYDLDSLARQIGGQDYLQMVYVSDTAVVALFDDDKVRWHARLALPLHPALTIARNFKAGASWTQKELVRLLRTELSTNVNGSVIDTFASLKFTSNSDTASTTRPMSAGLDRSIHQAVRGQDGQHAPDFIDLRVPVFDIPEARTDAYPVRVFVDYDHEKGVFLLVARQDDLRVAQETAVRKVILHLEDDERVTARVAYGSVK